MKTPHHSLIDILAEVATPPMKNDARLIIIIGATSTNPKKSNNVEVSYRSCAVVGKNIKAKGKEHPIAQTLEGFNKFLFAAFEKYLEVIQKECQNAKEDGKMQSETPTATP